MGAWSAIPSEGQFFLFLTASSVVKLVAAHFLCGAARKVRRHVGKVVGLKLFPLKSGRSIEVSSMECGHTGLWAQGIGDRSWMVVTQNYQFVTARQDGRLLLIQPSVEGETIALTAPGMSKLVLPQASKSQQQTDTKVHGQPVKGVDCGEEAAQWISTFLGKPGHRILCSPDWLEKRLINNGSSRWNKLALDKDKVAFSDVTPLSLMNTTSLSELRANLPIEISEDHFRANIIMEGDEGNFTEDKYLDVYVGQQVVLRRLKTTDRCMLTTVNPKTGVKYANEEPLHSMRKFRMLPGFTTPCFNLSLTVTTPGMIRVGDDVMAVME